MTTFAFFFVRLFMLQIVEGETYRAQADDNRFETVNSPAPRGIIYDRNGFQLVRNIPSFNVVITPALLPDSNAETEAIYQRLSEITGVPIDQEGPPAARCVPGRGIRQLVTEGRTNRPFDAWPIACDIDETAARLLREESIDFPGVDIEITPVRDYTTGDLTSALIGYLGPIPAIFEPYYTENGFIAGRDKIGYAGIEFGFGSVIEEGELKNTYIGMYQKFLSGENGVKQVEVDVAGRQLREIGEVTQPVPGRSLRLTIDTRLQASADAALRNRMMFINRYAGEERTPIGVVIAMDPRKGEILAMVSLPT